MAFILGLLLLIIPLWRICKRAGFHPAISLFAAVPGIGLLAVGALLAFADWPARAHGHPDDAP